MKGKVLIIFVSCLTIFCLIACKQKSIPPSKIKSAQKFANEAVRTIKTIFNSSLEYRQDFGEDPNDIQDLIKSKHLVIDERISKDWTFSIVGQRHITQIIAVSTKKMPFGQEKIISFSPQTGKFSGWFSNYQKSEEDFSDEAQRSIIFIHNAIKMYHQDYSEDPHVLEELLELEYLEIVEWVLKDWKFSFVGSKPITGITAVSTFVMSYGEYLTINFDLTSEEFSGWIFPESVTDDSLKLKVSIPIQYVQGARARD